MDTLIDFEETVMTTVDNILKKQKHRYRKAFLENDSKPVEITQAILKIREYPKTYKYIIGNVFFTVQFYTRYNDDNALEIIAVFNNDGNYGIHLQFDSEYIYSGTNTEIRNEIINGVTKANGNIDIIEKILRYMF